MKKTLAQYLRELSAAIEARQRPDLKNMSIEDLEKLIEKRYYERAPQKELDRLETEYARRISEDDLNLTEDDPDMSEGISLEEEFIAMYENFLRGSYMTKDEIIGNMRAALGNRIHKSTEHITDEQLFDAAKDLYDAKQKIIKKIKEKRPLPKIRA